MCCVVSAVAGAFKEEDLECLASDEVRDEETTVSAGEKLASLVVSITSKTGKKDLEVKCQRFNLLVTNGLFHPYHLDESTSILGTSGFFFAFFIFISFFDEDNSSKQNSSRWNAEFLGVTAGAILFAYVH